MTPVQSAPPLWSDEAVAREKIRLWARRQGFAQARRDLAELKARKRKPDMCFARPPAFEAFRAKFGARLAQSSLGVLYTHHIGCYCDGYDLAMGAQSPAVE